MKRWVVCSAVALVSLGLMAANFGSSEIQALVSNSLAEMEFESLGAGAADAPERFKVSERTMLHLRKLQLEGKVIQVDANGRISIR